MATMYKFKFRGKTYTNLSKTAERLHLSTETIKAEWKDVIEVKAPAPTHSFNGHTANYTPSRTTEERDAEELKKEKELAERIISQQQLREREAKRAIDDLKFAEELAKTLSEDEDIWDEFDLRDDWEKRIS